MLQYRDSGRPSQHSHFGCMKVVVGKTFERRFAFCVQDNWADARFEDNLLEFSWNALVTGDDCQFAPFNPSSRYFADILGRGSPSPEMMVPRYLPCSTFWASILFTLIVPGVWAPGSMYPRLGYIESIRTYVQNGQSPLKSEPDHLNLRLTFSSLLVVNGAGLSHFH